MTTALYEGVKSGHWRRAVLAAGVVLGLVSAPAALTTGANGGATTIEAAGAVDSSAPPMAVENAVLSLVDSLGEPTSR